MNARIANGEIRRLSRIVTGADNNVWFTETVGGKVGKVTTSA